MLVVGVVIATVLALTPALATEVAKDVRCNVSKVLGAHERCSSAATLATRSAANDLVPASRVRTVQGASDLRARVAVAAPCASQGSCGYCGIGGIGTGGCTKAKLRYNVAWCARNSRNLRGNGKKCRIEADWLSDLDNRIFTRCNIASALAAAGVAKESKYWLELTELSDPWVGGLSWLASTLGTWYAEAYCNHH